MDVKQLRAFLTISETQNITKAAALLNIVQPAVSRQIHLLEEELGVKLFERGRHGMHLTDEGKVLAIYARRALNEIEQAKMELMSSDSALQGTINIGIVASLSELLAVALMRVIKQKYPQVNLKISVGYSGHLQDWLVAGDIDLALNYAVTSSKFIDNQPLVHEKLYLVGPADAELNPEQALTMQQMAALDFILPFAPHKLRTVTEQGFKAEQQNLKIVAEMNDLNIQKQMVKEGFGYSILPLVTVQNDLKAKTVTVAPIDQAEFSRDIAIGLPRTRHVSKLMHAIAYEIKQYAKLAVENGTWRGGEWIGD